MSHAIQSAPRSPAYSSKLSRPESGPSCGVASGSWRTPRALSPSSAAPSSTASWPVSRARRSERAIRVSPVSGASSRAFCTPPRREPRPPTQIPRIVERAAYIPLARSVKALQMRREDLARVEQLLRIEQRFDPLLQRDQLGTLLDGQIRCLQHTHSVLRSEEHTSELQSQSNLVCR